jgi:hypothetical protein
LIDFIERVLALAASISELNTKNSARKKCLQEILM